MTDIAQELLDMKQEVEKAETEVNRHEGREQADMDVLKDKFGATTLSAAEKKLAALTKSIDADDALLKKGIKELREDYTWEN